MILDEQRPLWAEGRDSVVRGGKRASPHQIVHRAIEAEHEASTDQCVPKTRAAFRQVAPGGQEKWKEQNVARPDEDAERCQRTAPQRPRVHQVQPTDDQDDAMQVIRKLVAVEADESFAEDRERRQGHEAAFALADERRDAQGGIEEEKRKDLLQDPKARIAKQSVERRGDHARQRGVLRKELSAPSQREHILMVPMVAVAAEAAELVFEHAKFGRL